MAAGHPIGGFFRTARPVFKDENKAMNGTMTSNYETTRISSNPMVCKTARSDEELLLQYRETGNQAAFDELVGRYERQLTAYLRRFLNHAEMAQDIAQQTFLQVHLKASQFEAGRRFRPWLYAVATHQAIDAQRQNRRHRAASLNVRFDTGTFLGDSLEESLTENDFQPADQAERAEDQSRMRLAMERLPEPLKQVVMLVYYQGLKHHEASAALGLAEGTLKSRLTQAMRKLSQFYAAPAAAAC